MDIPLETLKERIKGQRVVKYLLDCRFKGNVYLVGGAIRELCLNNTPKDYDLALSDRKDLNKIEHLFGKGVFVLGKKPIQIYRLAKKDISIDITLLDDTIEKDLSRRDFTINAIAFDIKNNVLVDPLNGLEDIKKGLIVYPSKISLIDDPLRMLKAIRHFSNLKDFKIHRKLIDSIKELKHLIIKTAPERIKYELDRIIVSPNPYDGIKMMEKTSLLFEIFPELACMKNLDIEKRFVLETFGHTIAGFMYLNKYNNIYQLDAKNLRDVGYALLFHDLGKPHTFSYDENKNVVHFFYHERYSQKIASNIMERLRFSSIEIKNIIKLIQNHMRIFLISNNESTEKAIRRIVYKMEGLTPSLILLSLCDMYGSSGGQENPSTRLVHEKCDELLITYTEWKKEPLPRLVNGYELIEIGFKEGPQIGKVMNEIRERQIAGDINEKEEALAYAKQMLRQNLNNTQSHL
ncbi:MAG TPA: HD domain-containing protein [Syntrophorhabdaceae bacterium]|nr:HD domain-containing protein [Syntrophorhabdaceae bacterium]